MSKAVTAETITDDQIRELLEYSNEYEDHAGAAICHVALRNRQGGIVGEMSIHVARGLCAAAYNNQVPQ